ncbi:MAG: cytochrome d ubiquinol oxidase subunit II [Gordonia sp. (in: high G+C Gram-positive bacteria)]|uniref:cytochrome d ubiquinol oxidase subunit II n=1 Tax=Gordonia sp. (in: high G+C Gram-positive bacteria) TaxID=84139 RepID=UPI0039E5C60B
MGLPEFWFILIGVLFTGYFVLEGFDFGVGMLMGILGRGDDKKRRAILNTIGPLWDGNEVWLLTAGGAMFAAFGGWYATMFTAFYIPLLIILVALIVRVCAIEWRGKINDAKWRQVWDWCIAIGSWIPALLWGVAFANVVRGLPINEKAQFTGTFWGLLNPYALLGGLTTLIAFLTHGAVFLALKTSGNVQKDSIKLASRLSIAMTVVAGAFLVWTQLSYGKGWTWAPVLIAALAAVATIVLTHQGREGWAFVATSIAIIGTIVTLFGCLFPNVLPSTTAAANSLTIDNTSSSHYTLVIMTWAAALITPIVLLYQGWSYWVFRKRISASAIPASTGLASLRG